VNGWVSRIVQSAENEETGISRKFESQGVVVRLMQSQDTGFGKRHSSWSTEVALPSFSVLGKEAEWSYCPRSTRSMAEFGRRGLLRGRLLSMKISGQYVCMWTCCIVAVIRCTINKISTGYTAVTQRPW
jgi:hypothetical protein